ncbi:hypothetical protein [Rhodoferax sp.]|uniref:hypothetical protein n=1 Tax=Rhodoferax sp. TaxID=50421 RepID=UPI00374D1E0A
MNAKAQSFYLSWTRRLALLTLGLLPLNALAQHVEKNDATTEPVIASVVLNGTLLAEAQLLHRELGLGNTRVWIPEKEAQIWRMDIQGREQRHIEEVLYVAFCGPSDRCFYDEASALLTMTLENKNLLPLRVMPRSRRLKMQHKSRRWVVISTTTCRHGKPAIQGPRSCSKAAFIRPMATVPSVPQVS